MGRSFDFLSSTKRLSATVVCSIHTFGSCRPGVKAGCNRVHAHSIPVCDHSEPTVRVDGTRGRTRVCLESVSTRTDGSGPDGRDSRPEPDGSDPDDDIDSTPQCRDRTGPDRTGKVDGRRLDTHAASGGLDISPVRIKNPDTPLT